MAASEQAFKAHIHRLLDEHVAAHLTTSYVHSTQVHVYEILTASLLPVSEEDPRSLVPPSDILDDFIRGHCKIEPKVMCEGLPAVKESQERIYSIMKATPLNRTLTSQFPDTFCSYSPKSNLFGDPPVLTVRSIQHTPKARGSKISCFVPLKMTEVLSQISKEIASENFDDAVNTQDEDALHARLVVDDHNLKDILLSYKANPFSTSPPESAPSQKSLYRIPSPPLLQSLHRTPPLFSRINVVSKLPVSALDSMFDFPSVVPITRVSLNRDGDEGTPEYCVVNDEWAISSSPAPSPNDSASQQDDLFAPSPEPLGPIDDLLAANMDTFHIPRQLRAGKSHGAIKVPGQGQLLHEYIGDVVDQTRDTSTTTKLSAASDATVTSPTLVHCVGAFPRSKNICPSSDDVEDGILGRLTRHVASEAIDTVLFDQPNDIKHGLLDVPQLPPPNMHTRTVLWPNNMSSLINHEDFAAFYVAKGVKSLTLELMWRPYNSEKAIPTREELLGVSDFNYFLENSYADGEEGKTQLACLMKQLEPLTRPISTEKENQRELQAILKSLKSHGFNTDEHSTLNCGISNVLLTRAERHKSRLQSRTHLEGDRDNGTKWERGSCTTQPQSLERMIIDSPSEDECPVSSTDYVQLGQMDSGPLVYRNGLLSDPSEDVAPDAEIGIVSASHVHMPEESVVSVSTANLYRDSVPDTLMVPEIPHSPHRSWIGSSETGGLEANYVSASSGLASREEQSLHGYLYVLAKQSLLARSVNDIQFTSSASSGVQRRSNPPVDTEVQLHELLKLAAPLPFLEVSPHYNHRYLASVELLQDRPLMRALHVDSLRIELLEREWLDGADIVFDCDTALVFVPMSRALLPSSFRSFKDRLSSLSWRYTHLVVVFQLYDCGVSGPQNQGERVNSFARVIKSIQKLHRELALAEVFGTKQPQTVVQMYSVRSNEEAATAARLLGDMTESRSQFGPWGDRLWLAVDEKEDERYLTAVDGMNAFAAAAILGYVSLQDFLALRADQRLQLGLPIPERMINRFNEVIAERREHVATVVGDDDGSP